MAADMRECVLYVSCAMICGHAYPHIAIFRTPQCGVEASTLHERGATSNNCGGKHTVHKDEIAHRESGWRENQRTWFLNQTTVCRHSLRTAGDDDVVVRQFAKARHDFWEKVFCPAVIGIEKRNKWVASFSNAGVACRRQAGICLPNDTKTWVNDIREQSRGVVCGTIVNDDDLKWRVRLSQHG